MKKINWYILPLIALFLLSCAKKGNVNSILLNKAESFLAALSSASPESKYSISKLNTRKDGWVVFGQTNSEGETTYIAFDLNNYQIGEDLNAYAKNFESKPFSPYAVVTASPSLDLYPGVQGYSLFGPFNIAYPDPDLTYVFEETSSSGKDLEMIGSVIEGMEKEKIIEVLNVNLGLSLSRAEDLALVFNSYQKMLKKRSLTQTEYNQLTRKVLGEDYLQVKEALEKYSRGDDNALSDLIDKAAAFNGTNPENLKEFILDLLNRS